MKIGDISARAGVPRKTLRFWEEEGLVPELSRTVGGYRDDEPEVVAGLSFIRQAQAAGLTLEQIHQIRTVSQSGERPFAHVTELIARRLGEIDERIAELIRTRRHLAALAERATVQDPRDCREYCSIITD